MKELAKQYDPSQVEDRIYQFWLDGGYFHTKADPDKKPYTIVMPPPDAKIIVAGPFPISGTAALVGTLKAYEEMTGKKLDDKVTDAAMDELEIGRASCRERV